MGRILITLHAVVGLLAGCSTEHYAQVLLTPHAQPGKWNQNRFASGEEMVRKGEISAHRRVAADDGVEIDVWVLRGEDFGATPTGATVLLLHGRMDSKAHYYALAKRLAGMGHHAVLLDHRAHGRSGGDVLTWGAKEKVDARTVIDSLLAEGLISDRVYVFGHSMGAATAVMYAAIDPRCRGCVAVAPYMDARSVTRRFVPLMSDAKFEAVWQLAARKAGFDPDEASVLRAAVRLQCPLLVIHGAADPLCPYGHGRAVYEVCPAPKQIVSFPLTGHVSILLAGEKWFAGKIDAVIRGELPEKAAAGAS